LTYILKYQTVCCQEKLFTSKLFIEKRNLIITKQSSQRGDPPLYLNRPNTRFPGKKNSSKKSQPTISAWRGIQEIGGNEEVPNQQNLLGNHLVNHSK